VIACGCAFVVIGVAAYVRLRQAYKLPGLHPALLNRLVTNTFDGLVVQDMNGNVEWANPAYEAMHGRNLADMIGKNPLAFALPEDETPTQDVIDAFSFDDVDIDLGARETRINRRADGTLFYIELSVVITPETKDRDRKAIVISRDVTKQVHAEAALKAERDRMTSLAETDPLTGLANRTRLNTMLTEMVRDGQRSIGYMQIDLDHFKATNDHFGHAAGDAVLTQTAARLTASRAKSEGTVTPCRIGGDEFVVVVADCLSLDALTEYAEYVSKQLEKPMIWGEHLIDIGNSIGVSFAEPGEKSISTLQKEADIALYAVKNNGRNGVLSFGDALHKQYENNQSLAKEFFERTESGDFRSVLSPVYDFAQGRIGSFEFLSQWPHKDGGHLNPADIPNLAVSATVFDAYNLHNLNEILRIMPPIFESSAQFVRVDLQMAGPQPFRDSFLNRMVWAVDHADFPKDRLILEVSEDAIAQSPDALRKTVKAVSNLGYNLALSHFGRQHAALGMIAKHPFLSVKLDPSVCTDLAENPEKQAICRATVEVCNKTGTRVVATGVTETSDKAILQDLGCTACQGPVISPFVAAEDATAMVADVLKSALNGSVPSM